MRCTTKPRRLFGNTDHSWRTRKKEAASKLLFRYSLLVVLEKDDSLSTTYIAALLRND